MSNDSTSGENVTTEEKTKVLEELQKDFPQSKESSISFFLRVLYAVPV